MEHNAKIFFSFAELKENMQFSILNVKLKSVFNRTILKLFHKNTNQMNQSIFVYMCNYINCVLSIFNILTSYETIDLSRVAAN